MQSKFSWRLEKTPDHQQVEALSNQLALQPTTVSLLVQRGFDTAEKIEHFLNPSMAQLHDPMELHDMDVAIQRIQDAIMNGEKIVIYGDYDVDGLTSTTIMKEAIEMLGGEVQWYIPNRFTDGYGPNLEAYQRLIAQGAQLIITVDNGIAGKEVVEYAEKQGVDVVVTDHHELPEALPDVTAVVHPRYPGSEYPFGDLSGAGVAFKVACALLEEVPEDLLDLAALGTVADLVSLTGENRILVTYGLKVLQHTTRVGLQVLYELAKIDPETITETTIGFGIGPRLNALGRMGDANEGVTLLSTLDEQEAQKLAGEIQEINGKRQKLVSEIAEEAEAIAQEPENQAAKTLVIASEGWHEGVLGIVASRIVGETGKPTLILNIDPETGAAKGSGRSVSNYHLFNSLTEQRDLMTHFGGHHMAVGLTVPKENLTKIHAGMEAFAQAQHFEVSSQPEESVDLVLPFSDCTLEFYQELQKLSPFGTDNPQPIFEMDQLKVSEAKTMGKSQQHLRLQLAQGQQKLTAVGFGFGEWAPELQNSSTTVAVIGTLNLNHFRQNTTLQLMVTDLTTHAEADAVTEIKDEDTVHTVAPTEVAKSATTPEIQVYKQAQLTTGLFQNPALYVFFKERYFEKMRQMDLGPQANLTMFYEDQVGQSNQIVVVDQPDNFEQLNFFLTQQKATQITFAFFNAHPLNFQIPGRTIFSKALIYAKQHGAFEMSGLGNVANYLHLPESQLRFIFKVFSQLGFVKIEDGVLQIADLSTKKALNTAPLFKTIQERLEVEQAIGQASNAALTQRIQKRLLDVNR